MFLLFLKKILSHNRKFCLQRRGCKLTGIANFYSQKRNMNNNNNDQSSTLTLSKKVMLAAAAAGAGYFLTKYFANARISDNEPTIQQEPQPAVIKQRSDSWSSNVYNEAAESDQSKTRHYVGKTALQVLEEICRYLKLDEFAIKKENEFMKNIILELVEWLKQDPLFEKLFQEIAWTGSFYEGLKIEKPDEFDLNVVLQFPCKSRDIQITTKKAIPANVCISNFREFLQNLNTTNHPHWNIYKKMENWCDENGALKQNHIRIWLESLIDKFINKNRDSLMRKYKLTHLRHRKSGPALTLELNKMSIDLVPAFECKSPMVPPSPFKKIPENLATLSWYLIPKPVPGRDSVWRLSFYKQEQALIRGKECLKPAIKLIKKLRDRYQWKSLHSYFIKTVALWEIHDKKIHNNMKLDEAFFHLLRRLQTRLENNDLPSRWDPRYKLLVNMKDDERKNIANTLKKIIAKFDRAIQANNPGLIGEIIAPFPGKE